MGHMVYNENGSMAVEAIGSFLLYFFAMMSILTLINISAVQARVHYAVTQTANTLSTYAYILDVTEAADVAMNDQLAVDQEALWTQSQEIAQDISQMIAALGTLDAWSQDTIGDIISTNEMTQLDDDLDDFMRSYLETTQMETADLQNLATDLALGQGSELLFQDLSRQLILYYLATGDKTGDSYLDWAGVSEQITISNLDGSCFLDEAGDLKVVLTYAIDYRFGALEFPWSGGQLTVSCEAATKAWLSGYSDEYIPLEETTES